jgi:hypothetical protein
VACASLAAGAADAPRWYLQLDNDWAFDTDRWYSSGVRVARVADHGGHEIEWSVLQEIYTPEGKRFEFGTTVDRAPTARLLLALARHDRMATCFQTLELAFGVRGPSAQGKRTTEAMHEIIPAFEIDWSREEPDRLDAQLTGVRSHMYGQGVVHYGAVVGTERTFAHAGAEWRWGKAIDTSLLRFAPTPPPAAGEAGWGAFVGVGARAIARDELLSRGYDAALPAPEAEKIVGRLAMGVGSVQRWGSVLFSLAFDTREFESQRVPHRFGSLVVHVGF